MSFESDFRELLAVDVHPRVYFQTLPADCETPALTYSTSSRTDISSLTGNSGLTSRIFLIKAWASSPDDAFELRRSISRRLSGLRGVIGRSRVVVIGKNESEDFLPDLGLFQAAREFEVWYEEDRYDA